MVSRKSRIYLRMLSAAMVVLTTAFIAVGQEDINPNSPTPILISESGSTRALAIPADNFGRVNISRSKSQAFAPSAKVTLFLTNLDLMKDEGANAFRVYAQDSLGHTYRFPSLNLERVGDARGLYALTTELTDEIGYWDAPEANGDLAVYITWRGLASNTVRLGLGQMGGGVGEIPGAVPTPVGTTGPKALTPRGRSTSADFIGYKWSGDRIRFLEQATFGPTTALDERIRRIGLRTWLAEQFEAPYPSAAYPYPDIPLMPVNVPADCDGNDTVPDVPVGCFRDRYSQYPVQSWFYKEAFYGDSQLRHRVTSALNQIWVISGVDTQQSSHMIAYHQMLSKNAFGNWRQLMADMTLNPAMGNYLDMIRSTKTSPNENYPREVLQLFNVGLFMLNQDGTLQLDGSNNPIPTYTQDTVNNFTKVFTGWRDCNVVATCPNILSGTVDFKDPMLLVTGNHDVTAKTLLTYGATAVTPSSASTQNIAACTGCNAAAITTYANASLSQALDNIYNHQNIAPFASRLLIQHLVTSEPTPAYVGRVAAVFNANRFSPTQLKEVVKAILLDPEARGDNKTDPRYGKLREPAQFLTNIARQFDVRSADRSVLSDGVVTTETSVMGQTEFMSPTVFNFFPPDYTVPGTTLNQPEFAIFTTGTSMARVNFGNTIVFNRIAINAGRNVITGTSIDLTALTALAAADTTGGQLVDFLDRRMLHNTMSTPMRNTLLTAVTAVVSTNTLLRAQTALYLVATSSQYQVQR